MSEPVLVLSGSIGAGHDAVAAACSSALAAAGADAEVVDCMRLPGRLRGGAARRLFTAALDRPTLYDALHFSHLRADSRLAGWMERAGASSVLPALAGELDSRSTRLAIAVFATGAGALGRLRRERPELRSVVVLTDATAHRLWAHPAVDRYLAFSHLAASTLRHYLPAAEVVVVPPAVQAGCYSPPPAPLARQAVGLEPDGGPPVVLLAAGAWGRAPLELFAEALLGRGHAVIALAGSNDRLRHRLDRLAAARPGHRRRLVVCGWTDQVPALMAAADVVVSAPGQSCHEARAVGRPLVLLDVVPGHGRENLLAELAAGGALPAKPAADAVAAACEAALGGAAGELPTWPLASAAEWGSTFLDAIADLRAG